MYLFKISLLLFYTTSHVRSSFSNTKKAPKPLQYNTRNVNGLPDDHSNCFCFPQGPLPTVNKFLDSQDNGQERVVVYLYKNAGSSEIIMYTPNSDKQVLIPDIPYESSDGLVSVTTENVASLFHNNPHRIKAQKNRFENFYPTVIDSWPIGMNLGEIEHVHTEYMENMTPNNNDYSENEFIVEVVPNEENENIVSDHQGSINSPPKKFVRKVNVVHNGGNGNIVNKPNQGTINTLPKKVIAKVDVLHNGQNENIIYEQTKGPINSFQKKLMAKVDILPNEGNKNTFYEPQKDPVNIVPGKLIASPWTTPEVNFSTKTREEIEEHKWASTISYPYTKATVSSDNDKPNKDDLNDFPYTFETNDGSYTHPSKSQSTSVVQDRDEPVNHRYVTFNIWFREQLTRFRKIHLPYDITVIDNNQLKLLVLKILSKNNIYIGTDGVIKDSKGVFIDADNFELRPILLGETMKYQIVQNSVKSINVPKHLPYLEGILVTLINPSHVLGIIPLGKTILPKTSNIEEAVKQLAAVKNERKIYLKRNDNVNSASYSTVLKGPHSFAVKETYSDGNTAPVSYVYSSGKEEPQSYSYSSGNVGPVFSSNAYKESLSSSYSQPSINKKPLSGVSDVSYWGSGPQYAVSSEPYTTANWNVPSDQLLEERRKISDAKIKHHYEPPKSKRRKKGKGLTEKPGEVKETTTPKPLIEAIPKSGRRFSLPSLKGVVQTLLYLLNDVSNERDFQLGANATEEPDIINEPEDINNGERPDFRIIGGNAATGSGTPLNNKGRAGYNEYV